MMRNKGTYPVFAKNRRDIEVARRSVKAVRPAGYVYLIHAQGTEFVKVGVSIDVPWRLSTLQTSSPFELQVRAAVAFSSIARARVWEIAVREVDSAARVRGEWYRYDEPALGYRISALTQCAALDGERLVSREGARTALSFEIENARRDYAV